MDREMKILHQLQITTNPWEELIWKINLFNHIFWKERKWLCGTSKCLGNYCVTIQSPMNVLCKFRPVHNRQSLWSSSHTTQIQSNTTIWYKLYVLNMGVKLKGKHKAVIPLTEYAATSWQTFPWKNPTNREKGQASKEVCSVMNKTVFWCPNF